MIETYLRETPDPDRGWALAALTLRTDLLDLWNEGRMPISSILMVTHNIEEAVFFLGLRQIRELSMATPVIDELEQATSSGVPKASM